MIDLTEGLVENELEYLISPLLTIDEYESKISNKRAIVVGVFVDDQDPAKALCNFIDRSQQKILDTEVSPAPTPEGYYVVFVEIQRDDKFPKVLMSLLKEIENLCDIRDWHFQCPNHADPIELNINSISENIILNQADVRDDDNITADDYDHQQPLHQNDENNINEKFWKNSLVDSFVLEGNIISLNKNNNIKQYLILNNFPKDVSLLKEDIDASFLQSLLGKQYVVYPTEVGLLIDDGLEQICVQTIS